MLRILVQTREEDYVLGIYGDIEDMLTACAALPQCVPAEAMSADERNGLLRVRGEASIYLHAWLRAVETTHRATTIVWLPVAATA
jgi:hypothetical protein